MSGAEGTQNEAGQPAAGGLTPAQAQKPSAGASAGSPTLAPVAGPTLGPAEGAGRIRLLITAEEAYPTFERLVLSAEREIVMGFRIFDPQTELRSAEGLAIGRTWVDLLVHALRRGVDIRLWLSDFDGAAATDLHQGTWKTVSILTGIRELAGAEAPGTLTVLPRLHPSRPGTLARVLLTPLIRTRLSKVAREALKEKREGHGQGLKTMPGVSAMLRRRFGQGMPSWPVTHHQKLASVDGRWLYIGGLDLNERRWDTRGHDQVSQGTWHDLQVLIDDPGLAEAGRAHLENFDDVTEARADPVPAAGLLRTISARRRKSHPFRLGPKKVVTEIETRHHARIKRATRLIYLETQFFRDRDLARALAARAREVPDLKLILVMPAAPETAAFDDPPTLDARYGDYLQLACLDIVRAAFGEERMLVASPVQPRVCRDDDCPAPRACLAGAPIVYLHSKLSVFDGAAAILSSANLNGRSLHWDTEAGVELTAEDEVSHIRKRIQEMWLGEPAELHPLDDAFDHWVEAVHRNAAEPPSERHGFLVPYDPAAARAQAVPLPLVPPEMV
ncbi:phosphatidylserine/phosphatidylglycerophosphate/cardiolipin synthase family protein [Pseudoroseicyclus sp. CXY001]|uniref:phospholipase D-like domain-containing protein n=1 Tax=Pseudoroseicyclus sp. CXY001 TaxID=3242492 RepID=UPI00358DD267